ncbi:hypothetical protein SAMN04490202_4508 [Pseudomonas reinekei]|jgi:hypothetical protein|uniref:Uncharacterized protein n=1 Tax=Pseudomonas reinekei TaxID=395598 RepID=A0A1H0T6K8_PSERE|nr:hypothetical protein SAMN04490202_4508 [Pseudomonas reinekei]
MKNSMDRTPLQERACSRFAHRPLIAKPAIHARLSNHCKNPFLRATTGSS